MKPQSSRIAKTVPGLTLIEIIIVIAVLVALAGLVIPMLGGTMDTASVNVTNANLNQLRKIIMGSPSSPGYFGDLRHLPATMKDLFVRPVGETSFDRNTGHGWRGPYIENQSGSYPDPALPVSVQRKFTARYGTVGDPAVMDGWNHPIVIQVPTTPPPAPSTEPVENFVRLVSAGPDGILDTPPDVAYPTASQRNDDVVIFLRRADLAP